MGGVRPARFAQQGWYPADPARLRTFLEEACVADEPPAAALAVISPHAGYRFSGAVAGAAFARVEVPATAVVVGVSHRWAPAEVSVGTSGAWAMPGADVPIDGSLAEALLAATPRAEADAGEQALEHSLELQLPFLVHRNPAVRIVPVQVGGLDLAGCLALGEALACVLRARGEPVLVVASSDMHHQERTPGVRPSEIVPRLDALAIERIEALDPDGLYRTVRDEGITMCGVRPATIALCCARALGATEVVPVRHATSFDVTGDDSYVVGYYSAVVR